MNLQSQFLNQAVSDQVIALAYYSIPVALALSDRARRMASRAHAESKLILLFTGFIVSCGFGHQVDSYYEFRGICAALSPWREVWSGISAALSILTVYMLLPPIFKTLAILDAVDLKALIQRIKEMEADLGGR